MGASASNAADKGRKAPAAERPGYGATVSVAPGARLSWVQVPGDLLADTIGWVCSAGDAISFASGAQGRWLGVTLLCDSGVVKKQYHSYEEAQAGLIEICDIARKRAP